MKKILLFISLIVFCLASYGQQTPTKLTKQTIKTSGSYTWVTPTNSPEILSTSVGMLINTVNTSNFQGSMYLYGSWDGVTKDATMDSETGYTFTQTSGVNQTSETLYNATWYYPYAIINVTNTSDAQTISVTPFVKTYKKE